jgi:hypothetical protein
MGCGASTRPVIVLYINEANPPCELVAGDAADMPGFFPPSGLITKPDCVWFDDREFVKQCRSAMIEAVAVYQGELINGMEITYVLDGMVKVVLHGQTKGLKRFVQMQEAQHINSITCTWSEAGVHSLELTMSNHASLKAVGTKGEGNQRKVFSCAGERRGFVAFKGMHREVLSCLFVYTWKLVKNAGP